MIGWQVTLERQSRNSRSVADSLLLIYKRLQLETHRNHLIAQVFGDNDFAPAVTTDRACPYEIIDCDKIDAETNNDSDICTTNNPIEIMPNHEITGSSTVIETAVATVNNNSNEQQSGVVSPLMLRPPPTGCRSAPKRIRKKVTTSWLTSPTTSSGPSTQPIEHKTQTLKRKKLSDKPCSSSSEAKFLCIYCTEDFESSTNFFLNNLIKNS